MTLAALGTAAARRERPLAQLEGAEVEKTKHGKLRNAPGRRPAKQRPQAAGGTVRDRAGPQGQGMRQRVR